MNVAILYFGRINAQTGVSTVMKSLQQGFATNAEWKLNFYSLDADGEYSYIRESKYFKFSKISWLRKKLHTLFSFLSKKIYLAGRLYVWLGYDRNAQRVVRVKGGKMESADILFFHELFTPFYFEKAYPQVWNSKPKVVVLHSNGELMKMLFEKTPVIGRNKRSKQFYTKMGEKVVHDATALVFLSQESAIKFTEMYPQYQEKVFIVPNGMPELIEQKKSLPQQNSEKIRIVTVGTVCERKGHDMIVDAVLKLSAEIRSKIEIYVVGEGPLLNSLQEKCRSNNISNINFIGASTQVDRYLSESDVFLLASRDEGLPMAIIEAMRWKLPVIGTKVGGIPTMVENGVSGYLIDPNIAELVSTFEEIINSKENLKSMGEKSFHIFKEKFSIEKMVQGYMEVFRFIKHNT